MKRLALLFLLAPVCLFAQPNCNIYLFNGDTLQYKACLFAEKAHTYYQFRREFQELMDSAINICPHFAYAYKAKSAAYLKSGDFITWKKLVDKMVEYGDEENLGYRGWCRFQFFRDYKGAIRDIEAFDSLANYDIGYSVDGDYHLNIARAMCYSAIGEKQKAISIINQQLAAKDYHPGLYDYYQLGVTYFEIKDYDNALKAFEKQDGIYEFADNAYYRCKVCKTLNRMDEYRKYKEKALKLYADRQMMFNIYTRHYNSVYYETIAAE